MKYNSKFILLTGATGYIGKNLLSALLNKGYKVRCVSRNLEILKNQISTQAEVVYGDVLDKSSLVKALDGVDSAFYLVHSMGNVGHFEENDKLGASNFALACKEQNIKRIIYLGGLGDETKVLSKHLASRQEVGRILASSGVQTIEFRASIIIGEGSLSFELIKALVNRLLIMITPKWVSTAAQPIYVEDVINYLMQSLEVDIRGNRIFEIGGKDIVSYGDLMKEYAKQKGLRRIMLPVPFLTPYLSSLWLHLVTPVSARIGRKLIEGVRNPTIVTDKSVQDIFDVQPIDVKEAIRRCIA